MIGSGTRTSFIVQEVDGKFIINCLGCGGMRTRIADDFSGMVEILREERNNDNIAHQKNHTGEHAHI